MRIYVVATYKTFIEPIIAELVKQGYECVLENTFNKNTALSCDLIWCEWADSNALEVQNLPFRGKKILRIHAYEVYDIALYSIFNPLAFDQIIFVNQAIQDYFEYQWGRKLTNAIVLPNYIDTDRFTIAPNKKQNKNVAVVGQISRKKGIGEILMIAQICYDYHFHLVGDVTDIDIKKYIEDNPRENITYYDSIPNEQLPAFYADMTYYLNASLRESFGVSIMEAMACGLKPVIRNWVGAENWYKPEWLWDIIPQFSKKVSPEHYRKHVLKVANKDTLMQAIYDIVSTPRVDKPHTTLTIGIVKSREEYIEKAIQSLKMQTYLKHHNFNIHIIDNMKKKLSIGEAFNQIADECTTDMVMYLGDDDWLDECYIENCMNHYELRKEMYPEPIGIVTSCLYIENENGETYPCAKMPTGFWNTEYIRQRRFDETLPQQVDSDLVMRVREAQEKGEKTIVLQIESEFGYYYRQHGKNVSGDKITDAVRNGEGMK
jgi:hypothetical protein